MFVYHFGKRSDPPCSDCDGDQCSMNCGPKMEKVKMPWTAKDAYSHTKKANTPALQAQWMTIANSHLQKTGDEASAIRIANDAIANKPTKNKPGKPPGKPATEGLAPPQSLPMSGPPAMGGPTEGEG